jgi:hypothetical protein
MKIEFYKNDFGGSKPDFVIVDVDAVYLRKNKEIVIRLLKSFDGYVWSPDDNIVSHHPVDEDEDCLDEFNVLDRHGLYESYVVRS